MKKFIYLFSLTLLLIACGEPPITVKNQEVKVTAGDIETQELTTCSQMHFEKPPVDILYIVDNSGSTLASSFQAIKTQIKNTLYTLSNDFDYHVYIVPLNAAQGDNIQTYPLVVSDTNSLPSVANLNIVNPENLEMFAAAGGNNTEYGFARALSVINNNQSNGIFRKNANTIVVMISNGDDTESVKTIGGNTVPDENKFQQRKSELLALRNSPLNAETIRFISLVAHSNCSGWKEAVNYQRMSREIYQAQGFTDSSTQDTVNLCSGNYGQIFAAVNNSIKAVVVGHKYDHWKISSANESSIQADDIIVTKVKQNGTRETITESTSDGFEYLGYKTNQNTRYEPTSGEPQSGLMIKLNGNARVTYPDCIIAKTRTPTEWFGYVALPREPDVTTIKLEIDGKSYSRSTTHGWDYIGYRDSQNIKVPGSTGASTSPPVNRSGYFLKLYGDAIYTNGQGIDVYYKPKTN